MQTIEPIGTTPAAGSQQGSTPAQSQQGSTEAGAQQTTSPAAPRFRDWAAI